MQLAPLPEESAESEDRWHRPGGYREVLKLALPLMVSTLSFTVMQFVDRLMLTSHSRDAVAAALPGGTLAFVVICFPLGVAMYVNTFVSQYYGARRHDQIGLAVWQGVWLALACIPLAVVLNPWATELFRVAGHDERLVELEAVYFCAMTWCGGATVLSSALASFFTGRGESSTVMVVDSLAAALNVLLDYLWIFGHAGFPEWGIAGAAWATVASVWIKAAIYAGLFLKRSNREVFGTRRGARFDRPLMWRLLRFGSPNGVQFLLEVGAFAGIVLFVGKLGSLELAATSLAFNVNSLAFMPIFGIGLAAASLVGQRLGQDQPDLAVRSTWSALHVALVYMGVISALYVLTPQIFLWAHAKNADDPNFPAVQEMTYVLLRFVAAYCVFDALNIIFSSAIKGAGDTRFVLVTTIVMSFLPVTACYVGMRFWDWGLMAIWTVTTIWVCALGVVYLLRFLQGKWRHMRVIEQSPGEPVGGDEDGDRLPVMVGAGD